MGYWIVVVDDEPLSLMNAKKLLGEEDMRVSCLRSGQDLLKFMETKTPDLILLDILMPEMDGFETYHALRKQEDAAGKPNTPVIFLSGENSNEIERRGLKAGASDFVHKPFDKDALITRIYNTIENTKKIESLTEEATIDKLTGFLNKSCGSSKIANMCREIPGALMVFDLDNFKLVNDIFGHDMGDSVLKSFADIVRHNIRSDDVVSRIGGDEFMAFFPNLQSESAVSSLSERLNEQLVERCRKLMGQDFDVPIGVSIGAVFIPRHGNDYNELFRHADSSLYNVKQDRKHGFEIYVPVADSGTGRMSLEDEMARMTKLMEERMAPKGAVLLNQNEFTSAYRLIMRQIKENVGEGAEKILFALIPREHGQDISREVRRLGDILQQTLGHGDIIFRNRPDQYFVLIHNTNEKKENAAEVCERIADLCGENGIGDKTEITFVHEKCTIE